MAALAVALGGMTLQQASLTHAPGAAGLSKGDAALGFILKSQDGHVSLADYRGDTELLRTAA